MKFDLHTHHERCGHADGCLEDYIESAIGSGFQVIGVSDHSPHFFSDEDHPKPGIAMPQSEFSNYAAEVMRLKEKYRGKIEVLFGVESDFFPEHQSLYQKIYRQYPFDYIIGSVHHTNGTHIFDKTRWEGLSEEAILKEKDIYYNLIEQSAQSGMFDILGHIDAMKGYFPSFSDIQTKRVDQALKTIGETSTAIEINTSGKMKDCGGWYPADDILERACYYGVDVTFGSDAHTPNRVGDEWDEVRSHLKTIGYDEWVFFRNRQRVSVSL